MFEQDDKLSIKDIQRKNGQFVLSILKNKGANTVTELADEIRKYTNLDAKVVKQHVQEILTSGVELGFIYKKGDHYAADPIHVDDEDEELQDKPRRRKRKSSRRRSRSRSCKSCSSRSRSRRRRR